MCSVFFFSDRCIKQIDSMLPLVYSVIDHRGRQNVVKTTVTHSPAARVPLLCFYDILTSSVIYYWTHARQHGIYLLNLRVIWSVNQIVVLNGFLSDFVEITWCVYTKTVNYSFQSRWIVALGIFSYYLPRFQRIIVN